MYCSTPGFPVHHKLVELTQTHVHCVANATQPSHPLLFPFPAFNLSQHQVFATESVLCIRWPKYWSFSFSISPSNECSGLISFRMHWLDLLAVQGTLKSLLQHHSSKKSILWHSAFFMVQLSHPYMTYWKKHQPVSSVAQLHLTLCDPMDCSTPGPPVYHQLPEFTQTHVHWVCDTIQPSYPLSSLILLPSIFPSNRVFSNESLLASGGQGVSASASVLPMKFRTNFL